MLHLLYDTGLRAHELASLRISDFDARRGVLTVRHGKGDKARVLPYGQQTRETLNEYFRQEKPKDALFTGATTGEMFTVRAVQYIVNQALKRCGLPKRVHPHTLRHSFAVHYLNGHLKVSYNSCRNRHCPKCGGVEREAWIAGQEESLLPVAYFHVVFTLPDTLNGLCLYNPRSMYNALFEAAWQTLQIFGRDPKWLGAQTGATMVLHTWGQNLSLHPHVHCIVPGGGLSLEKGWIRPKTGA